MRYKVWIEIEGVPETAKEQRGSNDGYVKGGDLGVLPDPLGEFDTLDEARALVAEVVGVFNPTELRNSDSVDRYDARLCTPNGSRDEVDVTEELFK